MLTKIAKFCKFLKRLSPVVAALCLLLILPSATFAADSYVVNVGASQDIDEHGTCKKITNNAAGNIMVPTKSAAEWSSFRSNLPPGVTQTDCVNCNGVASSTYAGYNWCAAHVGDDCNTACSTAGGVNMVGTRNYVGSSGTLASCGAVATTLGVTLIVPYPLDVGPPLYGPYTAGCALTLPNEYPPSPPHSYPSGAAFRWLGNHTTATGILPPFRRVCACNN